jgi:hypothetical protein
VKYMIDCGDVIRVRRQIDKRKIRYDNPISEYICEICRLEVPIEQEDHLWSHCRGILGSPPSKDPMEDVYRVKRRCLELSKIGRITKQSTKAIQRSATDDDKDSSEGRLGLGGGTISYAGCVRSSDQNTAIPQTGSSLSRNTSHKTSNHHNYQTRGNIQKYEKYQRSPVHRRQRNVLVQSRLRI